MPKFRFLAVIIISFFIIVSFMLSVVGVLTVFGVDMQPAWKGLVFFIVLLAFAGIVLRKLALLLLYPKESADLAVLGGIQYGGLLNTMFTGKGASWPFCKLLADRDSLCIHTPWETLRWSKAQAPALTYRRRLLSSALTLDYEAKGVSKQLTFYGSKNLNRSLESLGFRINTN